MCHSKELARGLSLVSDILGMPLAHLHSPVSREAAEQVLIGFHPCEKIQSSLRKQEFIMVQSLRPHLLFAGQELEEAGHTASRVREQSGTHAGEQLAFFVS